jgi:hypothetical protein
MSFSHFNLPFIQLMDESFPHWIQDEKSWMLDDSFKKIFENARDGQGFSLKCIH